MKKLKLQKKRATKPIKNKANVQNDEEDLKPITPKKEEKKAAS